MAHPLFRALREASELNPDEDTLKTLEKLKSIYELYQNKPDTADTMASHITFKSRKTEMTRPSTRPRPKTGGSLG